MFPVWSYPASTSRKLRRATEWRRRRLISLANSNPCCAKLLLRMSRALSASTSRRVDRRAWAWISPCIRQTTDENTCPGLHFQRQSRVRQEGNEIYPPTHLAALGFVAGN